MENQVGKKDDIPTDVEQLKLKNLDTGECFIIGENDPDFEFDTFALGTNKNGEATIKPGSWLDELVEWLFGKNDESLESPPPPPESNARFTKLSSFKFRRELGKGAFGRVLLAEAKTDGTLYAIKIITKKNMRSSDVKQLKAERDILHSMSNQSPHPFTTGLKFAFQSENNLYLGMNYLPGGNLKQLIQRFGCLPEDWVQFYAAELVLALSHLHSLNVLYRDIKPHNVMLDAQGHIILIDYGLSKTDVDTPAGAQSLVGTPDYSAPEVLKTGVFRIENEERAKQGKKKKIASPSKGEIGYGKAADWWSLGVMIFEMLAGLPAFRGVDLRQTYQKVLYADVKFEPENNFSVSSRDLILGLLRRDPAIRLGSKPESPEDIKACAFFESIDWEGIYSRKISGPWVPDVGYIRKSTKSILNRDDEEEDNGKGNGNIADTVSNADSELINIRDSIICAPSNKKGGKQYSNQITDWSFMDESALASAAAFNGKRF